MRRIHTVFAGLLMLVGGTAVTAQQNRSTSLSEIRAQQRTSQARNLAERQNYQREREKRFATAQRYHEQQRIQKDQKHAKRIAYNRQRQSVIERNRENRLHEPSINRDGRRH